MLRNTVYLFALLLSACLLVQCHQHTTQDDINKIHFNYNAVDEAGMKHEGVAVDYEFCIPAKDVYAKRVQHIEPKAIILSDSKGRSGCSDDEWLCIVSNHDGTWKKKLFGMASLPFVEKIQETFYE
jgi:hypothetical protein